MSAQLTCTVRDGQDVIGYLAIDSFASGRSHGGVRMREDVSPGEIELLARTMTRKYAFLGLPFGGAKAGVVGDPEAGVAERRERLAAFAQGIQQLLAQEIFVPAADMGTSLNDIRHMLDEVDVHFEGRRIPDVDSGLFTAHSAFAVGRELAADVGMDIRHATVAIEGFGKVGSALARLLSVVGSRVVAVSTSLGGRYRRDGLDVDELLELSAVHGRELVEYASVGDRIAVEEVKVLPVDILFLCAAMHTINESNLQDVSARVLCPAANNPWPETLEPQMDAMGITYAPDFATNSGGVLGTTMAYAGFPEEEIVRTVEAVFAQSTRWILGKAKFQPVSVRYAANDLATRRSASAPTSPAGRIRALAMQIGLWCHRRGLAPLFIVRPFARAYFRRRMAKGLD